MNTYTPGQKVTIKLDPRDPLAEVFGKSFVGTYEAATSNPEHGFPHRVEHVLNGVTRSNVFADDEVSAA